jgi:adenine-specific DNA-methyltransferase
MYDVAAGALQLALFTAGHGSPSRTRPQATVGGIREGQTAMTQSGATLQDPLKYADDLRMEVSGQLDPERRATLGQFLTPLPIARLMASMLQLGGPEVRLLDPGAGVGVLTAACVERLLKPDADRPKVLRVTACEIDPAMSEGLRLTLKHCAEACADVGIEMTADVVEADFISYAVDRCTVLSDEPLFNAAILNPPYKKIQNASAARRKVRQLGLETSNLYTAFVGAAIALLAESGQIVGITPRSFCNGTYFRPFRAYLLGNIALDRLHLFESRSETFRDDNVLQENVIFGGTRAGSASKSVVISSSARSGEAMTKRKVRMSRVVTPGDPELFIHIPAARADDVARAEVGRFRSSLKDLGLSVSTGRVVDFRSREHLRAEPTSSSAPLIYPGHLSGGLVQWPRASFKKANAIEIHDETVRLLVERGCYVLVKRFSAKEERRRLVATVITEDDLPGTLWGFENHLNFFHNQGRGLDPTIANGLAVYLNSTLLDVLFRQFNGHTQVNAGDLRSLRYPSLEGLRVLGSVARGAAQAEVDAAISGLTS